MANKTNLKKYLKIGCRWQFVPVYENDDGKFQPAYVVIDHDPVESGNGTFYLEWPARGNAFRSRAVLFRKMLCKS